MYFYTKVGYRYNVWYKVNHYGSDKCSYSAGSCTSNGSAGSCTGNGIVQVVAQVLLMVLVNSTSTDNGAGK